MIKVLIVEDDDRKVSKIRDLIDRLFFDTSAEVAVRTNCHDASILLKSQSYDVLIIDLNLPLRPSEPPRADAGVTLVKLLDKDRSYRIPKCVVGLTSFEELASKYDGEFKDLVWSLIRYDASSDVWASRLGRVLIRSAQTARPADIGFRNDLAILTALHRVELEAVLRTSPDWKIVSHNGDASIYHVSKFERSGKTLSVVAVACPDMGMPSCTAMAMKVIDKFRPRYLAMAGIAAGTVGNFGDVLIADQAWDYGSGKISAATDGDSIFRPAPAAIPIDPILKAKLALFTLDDTVCGKIRNIWPGAKQTIGVLRSHMGPIASGASVVADGAVVSAVRGVNRKVIGIEMEAYGLLVAARMCDAPRPLAFVVKSVCDFADASKSDDHQEYAAFTSAQFLKEFALTHLIDS